MYKMNIGISYFGIGKKLIEEGKEIGCTGYFYMVSHLIHITILGGVFSHSILQNGELRLKIKLRYLPKAIQR